MSHLEHQPRSLWSSVEWAAETLTTTGYGHDNEWTHPFMHVFVIASQFLGQFMEHSMSLQPTIKIVKVRAGALAGSTVVARDIRRRTGCSIVAVERGGAVQAELESIQLEEDDAIYVSGTQEALERYRDLFDGRARG